jgi:hypothetical protein
MAYNPADKFPGANPMRVIDIATIVEALNPSPDVPVVYSFGAGAPTGIELNGREVLNVNLSGSFATKAGGVNGASGRVFVEFAPPYYPDP